MAPAIGAAMTALWFSFRPLKTNVGPKMLVAVAVFGVATIVFGFSTSMPLSLAMLVIVGAADMFSVYIRQSLIQLHTPDDKRGRVSSVSQLTISASNEFGDFFSGSLAFLIGPVAAVVAGGAGAIVTVAAWSRLFPVLRTTKTFDPPDDARGYDREQKRLTRQIHKRGADMKFDNVLQSIGNTPHIRLATPVPRSRGMGQERARQSRRIDQGSHRAGHGGSGGGSWRI